MLVVGGNLTYVITIPKHTSVAPNRNPKHTSITQNPKHANVIFECVCLQYCSYTLQYLMSGQCSHAETLFVQKRYQRSSLSEVVNSSVPTPWDDDSVGLLNFLGVVHVHDVQKSDDVPSFATYIIKLIMVRNPDSGSLAL